MCTGSSLAYSYLPDDEFQFPKLKLFFSANVVQGGHSDVCHVDFLQNNAPGGTKGSFHLTEAVQSSFVQ